MNCTKKTFLVVDYGEVDRFINEHYKPFKPAQEERPRYYQNDGYECAAVHEWGNDSSHEFHVDDDETDEWSEKEIAEWLSGVSDRPPSLDVLFADLCARKKIEPGVYLVNVCW